MIDDNIWVILTKIKYTKINFTCFYFNMAIRKLKMTYVACLIVLLDSTEWEASQSDQLNKREQRVAEYKMILRRSSQREILCHVKEFFPCYMSIGKVLAGGGGGVSSLLHSGCILLFSNLIFTFSTEN